MRPIRHLWGRLIEYNAKGTFLSILVLLIKTHQCGDRIQVATTSIYKTDCAKGGSLLCHSELIQPLTDVEGVFPLSSVGVGAGLNMPILGTSRTVRCHASHAWQTWWSYKLATYRLFRLPSFLHFNGNRFTLETVPDNDGEMLSNFLSAWGWYYLTGVNKNIAGRWACSSVAKPCSLQLFPILGHSIVHGWNWFCFVDDSFAFIFKEHLHRSPPSEGLADFWAAHHILLPLNGFPSKAHCKARTVVRSIRRVTKCKT